MKRLILALSVAVPVGILALAAHTIFAEDKKGDETALFHMVYFKLKDSTPANKKKLVEACEKYLTDHEGAMGFAAGVLAEDFKRDVNDRDWDVSLLIAFNDKAAHDKYADHPRHLKFIEENKEMWAKVRVFDSEMTMQKKTVNPATATARSSSKGSGR